MATDDDTPSSAWSHLETTYKVETSEEDAHGQQVWGPGRFQETGSAFMAANDFRRGLAKLPAERVRALEYLTMWRVVLPAELAARAAAETPCEMLGAPAPPITRRRPPGLLLRSITPGVYEAKHEGTGLFATGPSPSEAIDDMIMLMGERIMEADLARADAACALDDDTAEEGPQ